jgi:phosphatidylethanolamine/phosphatidyl-N-methylethanolamine N-methyltransferase
MDEFIKDLKNTGAVAPCSDNVAKALMKHASLHDSKTVVELGPGTGVITQRVLENISDDTLFLALDVNPHFVAQTQKKCPKAYVYLDTAENIKLYLKKHGRDSCDCVISTLPWTLFSKELQEKILSAVMEVLQPGGRFLTVTYTFTSLLPSGKRFRNLLRDTFTSIQRTKTIWKNIPPVHVYYCQK